MACMSQGCSVQFFADLYVTIGLIVLFTVWQQYMIIYGLQDNTSHVQSFLSVYNLKNLCEAGAPGNFKAEGKIFEGKIFEGKIFAV